MLVQGQVAPIAATASIAPGTQAPMRQGNLGEQVVQQLHGKYYESTYRRAVYNASIVGQVTTVGAALTYTGLVLCNPVGSTVNLVVLKAGYAFLVAFPAAATVGLMTGYNAGTNVTHTTPAVVKSNFIGVGGSGVGLCDSSATLPTAPILNTVLATGLTGAITTVPSLAVTNVDLDGSIILPPGAYCAFYTSTVSGAASGSFSLTWEEVPV